jgi:hypothetical protein
MPLILPHPITPTLTGVFSLMVAPFGRSARQHFSTSPVPGGLSARYSLRLALVSISARQLSYGQGLADKVPKAPC